VGLIEMIATKIGTVVFGVNASTWEYPRAAREKDRGATTSKKHFDSFCAVGGVTNENNGGGGNSNLLNLGLCPFLWSIAFCFVH
jgi:hypothetical protein